MSLSEMLVSKGGVSYFQISTVQQNGNETTFCDTLKHITTKHNEPLDLWRINRPI